MFARPSAWNKSVPTGRIFMKFGTWIIFENLSTFRFHYNLTRKTGTLHEDRYTFLIISRSVLLRIRNVSDKVAEKITIHVLCSVTFFSSENHALYEIMWKHFAVPGRTRMTLRHMRSACCVPVATHTQSEYLMLCRPCIVIYLRNKNQQHALFDSQFFSIINLYMFRAGLLLIIMRYLSVCTEYHLKMRSSKPARNM